MPFSELDDFRDQLLAQVDVRSAGEMLDELLSDHLNVHRVGHLEQEIERLRTMARTRIKDETEEKKSAFFFLRREVACNASGSLTLRLSVSSGERKQSTTCI